MKAAAGFFLLFCALVASRDAITQFLLSHGPASSEPLALVAFYCSSACVYGWLFKWYRTGSPSVSAEFKRLTREQKVVFVKLGVCTLAVYACTVYGIGLTGATMFNFVEYGLMPLMTIAAAMAIGKESPGREVFVGSGVAAVGVCIFFVYSSSSSITWQLNTGLILAILSMVFTSITTAYQKKQVDSGLSPDVVLMFRFPISAIALGAAAFIVRPRVDWSDSPLLLGVSFAGVFLPLLLLCYGFVESTLSRFTAYLFLIPIFTFILGPILVGSEWSKLTQPSVVGGMLIILLGFSIAEGIWGKKNPPKPGPASDMAPGNGS